MSPSFWIVTTVLFLQPPTTTEPTPSNSTQSEPASSSLQQLGDRQLKEIDEKTFSELVRQLRAVQVIDRPGQSIMRFRAIAKVQKERLERQVLQLQTVPEVVETAALLKRPEVQNEMKSLRQLPQAEQRKEYALFLRSHAFDEVVMRQIGQMRAAQSEIGRANKVIARLDEKLEEQKRTGHPIAIHIPKADRTGPAHTIREIEEYLDEEESQSSPKPIVTPPSEDEGELSDFLETLIDE